MNRYTRRPTEARTYLVSRTTTDPVTGCWLWTGPTTRNGYGRTRIWGAMWGAHRFAYHHLRGHLHRDHHVHHVCGVPRCVNPVHLTLVSPAENAAEMMERANYQATIRALKAEVEALKDDVAALVAERATIHHHEREGCNDGLS